MTPGKLIVLSAPAGTGKTSVAKELTKRRDIVRAITATTRDKRGAEQDGVDYFFMSHDEFEAGIEANDFLEYATVFEHYYGVPRKGVVELLDSGKDVLLVLDVQGGMHIREDFPGAILIFLLPPNIAELQSRLEGRGEDSPASITSRLRIAEKELRYKDSYDYRVINDDLERAILEVIEKINNHPTEK